jgi:hypothetical protein
MRIVYDDFRFVGDVAWAGILHCIRNTTAIYTMCICMRFRTMPALRGTSVTFVLK